MPDSGGKFQSFKIELWRPSAPNQIYSQNWCSFSMLKLTQFPSPFGGGFTFHYTRHVMKRFIPHVRRARPLNGFENGSNLAGIRIEYDLLISWDGYSFSQRTSSVRKSYHEMDLRNGISLEIKARYIKFGNKLILGWGGESRDSFKKIGMSLRHSVYQYRAISRVLLTEFRNKTDFRNKIDRSTNSQDPASPRVRPWRLLRSIDRLGVCWDSSRNFSFFRLQSLCQLGFLCQSELSFIERVHFFRRIFLAV